MAGACSRLSPDNNRFPASLTLDVGNTRCCLSIATGYAEYPDALERLIELRLTPLKNLHNIINVEITAGRPIQIKVTTVSWDGHDPIPNEVVFVELPADSTEKQITTQAKKLLKRKHISGSANIVTSTTSTVGCTATHAVSLVLKNTLALCTNMVPAAPLAL